MTPDDYETFADAWSSAYELVSRGKVPSAGALSLAFDALEPYPLEQVTAALSRHVRDPNAGRFGLTPADVVAQIDGTPPNTDQIIAAALNPRTPLAILCRIHIGTHDLRNFDRHQLKPAAEHCLSMLPEWRQRIDAGELNKHERERMEHYGVDMGARQLGTTRRLPGTTAPQITQETQA